MKHSEKAPIFGAFSYVVKFWKIASLVSKIVSDNINALKAIIPTAGKDFMAKFSFHCQCYKAGQLGGIDKHNRRLNKNYISNPDINIERSKENRIYIAPKQSLYQDCKDIINKR